ncbi:MAG: hypothetical protein ACRDDZ_06225 [Marinifilaceae bacterium]
MAVTKEIWQEAIVEGLFADNSFMSKAVNDDMYVNEGKKVHIPNAGTPSGVKKNRAELPTTFAKRADSDIEYSLDEYTTDPVYIPHAETVELSYDKRSSILSQDRNQLIESVGTEIAYVWAPSNAEQIVKTSGIAVDAHTSKATGKRHSMCKKDVLTIATKFNEQNIPQTDRYLLLDAQMYAQLLNDLTTQENQAFLACADASKGVLGQLYSLNVMMRSKVVLFDSNDAKKAWSETGVATDCAGAIAWHKNSVSRALGEVKMFERLDDPLAYGDVYSFLVRAAGSPRRKDKKGILSIVQGTPVAPSEPGA